MKLPYVYVCEPRRIFGAVATNAKDLSQHATLKGAHALEMTLRVTFGARLGHLFIHSCADKKKFIPKDMEQYREVCLDDIPKKIAAGRGGLAIYVEQNFTSLGNDGTHAKE